uniref:T-complex protein 1 subunit zeta n=1 Tax=Rhabditophanes sp. KR3021 TaxID=114890 RepID=A0AC35U051_9BILA
MSSLQCLNPRAEMARQAAALELNMTGAKGLQKVMKSNLGPTGTLKMLVSGSGEVKLTKDGNTLLHEMQIQHPTASLIAKTCTAQHDICGDGITSTVLLIGELLKQAERWVGDGVHPRLISEGFERAKFMALLFLETFKENQQITRDLLIEVARGALRTKLRKNSADHLTECIVDAFMAIKDSESLTEPDLHMIEIMEMLHENETDSRFIKGLVLDHGGRHPDMPKNVKNAFILTANVSLEFEKTEVNSSLFYKTAEEREKLLQCERDYITERVLKIIALKNEVCKEGEDKGFVIINQKGIDPPCLDLLAKNGILALRRAKRRNMERLQLACGGEAINSIEDLSPSVLGFAGNVYEHVLGEDKFTFIEDCRDPKSVTLLLKGPNRHSIIQQKDAIRNGLRAINNVYLDKSVVPGAGAFEVAAHCHLMEMAETVKGRERLGIQAFAESLLVIPKTLAVNAGHDGVKSVIALVDERRKSKAVVGVNLDNGKPFMPAGIWDNYIVKYNALHACADIASNLLLVDEVVRAGLTNLKSPDRADLN